MKKKRNEIRLGLTTIGISLVVLAYLLFRVGGQAGKVANAREYQMYFNHVAGLRGNANVHLDGLRVGRVLSITLVHPDAETMGRKARLRIEVDGQYPLQEDATAQITTPIFGDPFLDLISGSGEPLPPGSNTIVNTREPADFSKIMAQLSRKVDGIQLEEISRKTEQFLENLNRATGHEALPNAIQNIYEASREMKRTTTVIRAMLVENRRPFQQFVGNIRDVSGSARAMVTGNEDRVRNFLASLERSGTQLETTLSRANAISGSVGNSLGELRGGMRDFLASMKRNSGKLERLMDGFRWPYLYYAFHPPLPEEERERQLFEAVRNWSDGAEALTAGVRRLEGALSVPGEDPARAREMTEILEALRQAREKFRAAEEFFAREGGKGK